MHGAVLAKVLCFTPPPVAKLASRRPRWDALGTQGMPPKLYPSAHQHAYIMSVYWCAGALASTSSAATTVPSAEGHAASEQFLCVINTVRVDRW
eukprot:317625-Pelagomonas_calceolata.AAC.4